MQLSSPEMNTIRCGKNMFRVEDKGALTGTAVARSQRNSLILQGKGKFSPELNVSDITAIPPLA